VVDLLALNALVEPLYCIRIIAVPYNNKQYNREVLDVGDPSNELHTMAGKICIVTGANSGIGKETALGLARLGATVVMLCRNCRRGEKAQRDIIRRSGNSSVDLLLADLSSQQAIHQFVAAFQQRYQQLHVLVNNAGSVFLPRQLSVDSLEMTLAVNYLSGFLLTNLLLDMLKASAPARVVNVSSNAQGVGYINLDDLQMEKRYTLLRAYAQSKLANVLFTYALAHRLEGTGVTVNCLHPGVVATNIWSSPLPSFLRPLAVISRLFGVTPEEGAHTSLYLASSPEVEGVTGKYFEKFQAERSTKISYDIAVQERLWEISEELTGIARSTREEHTD
jgi:NAD(P)-dependent dehydrogenase (short-subunit alcohol dehydrogenase family)